MRFGFVDLDENKKARITEAAKEILIKHSVVISDSRRVLADKPFLDDQIFQHILEKFHTPEIGLEELKLIVKKLIKNSTVIHDISIPIKDRLKVFRDEFTLEQEKNLVNYIV